MSPLPGVGHCHKIRPVCSQGVAIPTPIVCRLTFNQGLPFICSIDPALPPSAKAAWVDLESEPGTWLQKSLESLQRAMPGVGSLLLGATEQPGLYSCQWVLMAFSAWHHPAQGGTQQGCNKWSKPPGDVLAPSLQVARSPFSLVSDFPCHPRRSLL